MGWCCWDEAGAWERIDRPRPWSWRQDGHACYYCTYSKQSARCKEQGTTWMDSILHDLIVFSRMALTSVPRREMRVKKKEMDVFMCVDVSPLDSSRGQR
jgi:hypothetical protein